MSTTAKVVADSISESGQRITTMVLEYPRIIHSEFMTHRQFSRNASSSRAIPVEKQIERVKNDPFIPSQFGKNKRGMQADEVLDLESSQYSEANWRYAADNAIGWATRLDKLQVHKQLANRLLEPFSHIQVVVTATEWENFFEQRISPFAQPEIQELATQMRLAMNDSKPKLLKVGEWHLPFVNQELGEGLVQSAALNIVNEKSWKQLRLETFIKISVARCARVSYGLNERDWGDIQKDLELYDRLYSSGHWSPFEHQATPIPFPNYFRKFEYVLKEFGFPGGEEYMEWEPGITHIDRESNFWSGNFKGHIQNRQLLQQTK